MNTPTILGDPEEIRESIPPSARPARSDPAAAATDEQKRQAAFDAEGTWKGRPLHPFSISRETLFLQLRNAAGAPGLYQAMLDGEAWFGDAVRILWLCLHGPEDWRELRGEPIRLQEAIDAWADENIPRGVKAEIVILTIRIWNDAQINAHEPVPGDAIGEARDPGN